MTSKLAIRKLILAGLVTAGLSLPAFQFQLLSSSSSLLAFHSNCFVLCLKRRTVSIPSLQEDPLSCKIANGFKDDLNDDKSVRAAGVLKGARYQHARLCDDLAMRLKAVQMVATWQR